MKFFHKPADYFPHHRSRSIWPMMIIICVQMAFNSVVLADDPIIQVARVSLVEGEVNYQRANDSKDDWFDATLNLPLNEGDQVYSGPDGRAEIQLSGRNIVRINYNTNLRFTQFNTSIIRLALPVGTATFRIDSLAKKQFQIIDAKDANPDDNVYFEVNTPTVAVVFLKEGLYRINVKEDGTTEVIVRRGEAEIDNQEIDSVIVEQGRRIVVSGDDPGKFKNTSVEEKDSWDIWNDQRDDELFARANSYHSPRYVPDVLPGVYDLDLHGEWLDTPDYGWVWCPRAAHAGWAPYRHGYWRWCQAYGWTWISHEPWGWLPYHYGRWTYHDKRWCWVPSVKFHTGQPWSWSPHLVAFFGWGDRKDHRGYERDRKGHRWLGWSPLAPGEAHLGHKGQFNNFRGSVDSLRNYRAPGGVTGMDGNRFRFGRAIVTRDALISPQRDGRSNNSAKPAWVKWDQIKPVRVVPTRVEFVGRPEIRRGLETQ